MHNRFSCITNLDKLTNFLLRVITNNKNHFNLHYNYVGKFMKKAKTILFAGK